MTLDPAKVKELKEKISSPEINLDPSVPKHLYARAKMEEHEGNLVPIFTRCRTKTFEIAVEQLDTLVDNMCNGSEDTWVLREVFQVQRRPGKDTRLIAIFVCVDEVVLPTLPDEEVDIAPPPEGDDIEQLAEAWKATTE